ncbi:hypothetical protein [Streptomyces sp. NPDC055099]
MSDAPIPRPHAESSAVYWLDSPAPQQHSLCACPGKDDAAERRYEGTIRYLLIGLACMLVVIALVTALTS